MSAWDDTLARKSAVNSLLLLTSLISEKLRVARLGTWMGLWDPAMASKGAFLTRTSRSTHTEMGMVRVIAAVASAVQRVILHATAPIRSQTAENATIVARPGTTKLTVQTRRSSVSLPELATTVVCLDTVLGTALRNQLRPAGCARRKVCVTIACLPVQICLPYSV